MKRLFVILVLCLAAALPAQQKKNPEKINLRTLDAEKFLNIVRHAPSREVWSKLSGRIQHRREGAAALSGTLRLGVRFTPDRIIGQLVLDGNEIYNLGQTFSNPPRSTRMLAGDALDRNKAKLGIYGLSPDDLLLGFLYKEPIREQPEEKVSLYNCRVFVMNVPESGEFARVFISTDYAFPLKVEWFRKNPVEDPEAEPYRTMEIVSIKEDGDFVLISKLRLDGPGWRTKIEFQETKAGYASDSVPADLFLKK